MPPPHAGGVRHRHDPHRFVPGRALGVVGRRHAEHVALLDRHAPSRPRRRHRDVPRHRARRLPVVRARTEQIHRAPVARELEVGVEATRVEMAGGPDEHAVALDHLLIAGCAAAVGVGRVVGVGEAPVLPAPAKCVEHRVGRATLDVEPLGADLADSLRGLRRVGDEVERVGDVDPIPVREQVVDHVVQDPLVARLVAVAEALRQPQIGLLLAGGERQLAVDEPHRVVQVQDVDARDRAVDPLEVGAEADDPAGALGLRHAVAVDRDRVLARLDHDRAVLELQMLDPRRRGCTRRQEQEYDEETDQPGEHSQVTLVRCPWCTLPFG